MKRLRILILCNHGNVRSVGLAYLIKTIYKHEAIAVGFEESSEKTLELLRNWADKIIFLTKEAKNGFPDTFKKTYFLDIGKDIWHDPFHHNLQHKFFKRLKELGL